MTKRHATVSCLLVLFSAGAVQASPYYRDLLCFRIGDHVWGVSQFIDVPTADPQVCVTHVLLNFGPLGRWHCVTIPRPIRTRMFRGACLVSVTAAGLVLLGLPLWRLWKEKGITEQDAPGNAGQ